MKRFLLRFGLAMAVSGAVINWASFFWPSSNAAWESGVAAMLVGVCVLSVERCLQEDVTVLRPAASEMDRRIELVEQSYVAGDIDVEQLERSVGVILKGGEAPARHASQPSTQDFDVFEPVVLVDGTGEVVDVIRAGTKTIKGRDVVVTDGIATLAPDHHGMVTGGCDCIAATVPDPKPEEEHA